VFFATHHNHFIKYAVSDVVIAETLNVAEEAFRVVRERHPF
jgi:glutamate-1-semialdehyde 2,1-aminomutase